MLAEGAEDFGGIIALPSGVSQGSPDPPENQVTPTAASAAMRVPPDDVIRPPTVSDPALRALAAARVAAAARSLSDSEASLDTAAAGRIPHVLTETGDRRVRWLQALPSCSSSSSGGGLPPGCSAGVDRSLGTAGGGEATTPGNTDAGSSSAGEDCYRFRVRRSRRQQQQGEGSGSRRCGKHKQRRWLHQQLLVAALRRLIFVAGENPTDATDRWGVSRGPSCWELLQDDPIARDVYIKRKESTWKISFPLAESLQDSSSEGQQALQKREDALLQRKAHCLSLMKKQQHQQQQRAGRPLRRAASCDRLGCSALVRPSVSASASTSRGVESLPSADAVSEIASSVRALQAAALTPAALSPTAGALARALDDQRVLLQQLQPSELQHLPSVQRMKSLRSAFRPLKTITKDPATLYALSFALEAAIRGAYPSLAAVRGGLSQLLHPAAAAAAAGELRKKDRPILQNSCREESSHNKAASSSTNDNGRGDNDGLATRGAAAASATGGNPTANEASEGRYCLLLWRLNGFERKVAHALVALTPVVDSFSVSLEDLQSADEAPSCTKNCLPQPLQQHHHQPRKRKVTGGKQKVVVICRRQHNGDEAFPPVSLAMLLVCAVAAAA
ncbi:uncharacterized protein LOC34619441 [Cyclospora cayetanensis]|uniref:Uncharacterized protein LOC34619441 n=1 Tax=Cyclospora cayetanensis TaxID=88456 RepID=A0A6P6RRT5_9EIME|nr:uncharacterized protein LOC34619441 [Cyclospora cayetanensis]